MKVSEKGIHLMHRYEGYRNRPYKCSARIWTIGWGHALYPEQLRLPNFRSASYAGMIRDEFALKEEDNRVWSKEELVDIFTQDLVRFECGVLRLAPNLDGRQGAFDACVSFSFNAGLGNFQRSAIRMKNNRGEFEAASDEFLKWVKGGGKVLPGLVKRRQDERKLYLS